MATDEIYNIIAKVQGEADVKRLAHEIALEEAAIRGANEQLQLGAITHLQFDNAVRRSAGQIILLRQELKLAESAVKSASGSFGNAGQIMTQAGYFADDLQYGFKGIANNIQPILSLIPGLGTLAPVLAISATATYQLYTHWDQIAQLWGGGHTQTQAEAMEELGKKTEKTAQETKKLADYEAMRKNLKEQQGPTAAQSDQQRKVNTAVREGGAVDFRKGVDAIEGKSITNGIDQKLVQDKADADAEMAQALKHQAAAPEQGKQWAADLVESARKKADAAQDALNEAYSAGVDKFITEIGGDEKKLRSFLDKAWPHVGKLDKDGKYVEGSGKFGPGGREALGKMEEALPSNQETPEEKRARETKDFRVKQKTDREQAMRDSTDQAELEAMKRDAAIAKSQQEDRDSTGQAELVEMQRDHDREEGRKKDASAIADKHDGGALGSLALGGKLTNEAVARGMRRSGSSADEVARLGPHVGNALRKRARDKVEQRAAEKGITPQAARKELVKEHALEEREKMGLSAPGVIDRPAGEDMGDAVSDQLSAALGAGAGLKQAQSALYKKLIPKYGTAEAKRMVNAGTSEGLSKHADNMQEQMTKSKSQVIDTAGLADSIQSSVGGGGDLQKQAVDQLKEVNKNLMKQLNAPSSGPIIRK